MMRYTLKRNPRIRQVRAVVWEDGAVRPLLPDVLLPELAEILLQLEETARNRLLQKMRPLKTDVQHLLENARPP